MYKNNGRVLVKGHCVEGHIRIGYFSNVRVIDNFAFERESKLFSVEMEDCVKRIGMWAFSECRNLHSIHLSNSVKEILRYAFADCRNLRSIVLPESLKAIEEGVFSDCNSLEVIVLPSGLKKIGFAAFDGCRKISQIYSKVQDPGKMDIDEGAFGNSALSMCTLKVPPGSEEKYKQHKVFSKCKAIVPNLAEPDLSECYVVYVGLTENLNIARRLASQYDIKDVLYLFTEDGADYYQLISKHKRPHYSLPEYCRVADGQCCVLSRNWLSILRRYKELLPGGFECKPLCPGRMVIQYWLEDSEDSMFECIEKYKS